MKARPSARRAFWGLVALAALGLAGLAGLLAWQAPVLAQGRLGLACQSLVAALRGYLPLLGLALPAALLLGGLLAAGLAVFGQLRRTRRLVHRLGARRRPLGGRLTALAQELEMGGRLVLVEDAAAYTFTQGLRRPVVWLSTGLVALLDDAELRAVLCHERHHVRQRDPLRVLVSRSLAHALFFAPLAAALRDAYLLSKEIDADAASGAGEVLAAALLKVLRSGSTLPETASLAAIGPVDATAARVHRLLDGERTGDSTAAVRAPLAASLAVAVVVAVSSVFSAVQVARAGQGTGFTGPAAQCGYQVWSEPAEQSPAPMTPAGFTPVSLDLSSRP